MEALYFTATWCQPCKVFGPVMEKVKDIINVRKYDIEQHPDMISQYDVYSVPTVILLGVPEGIVLDRKVGAQTEQTMRDWIMAMGEE